jgi:cytochrome P450
MLRIDHRGLRGVASALKYANSHGRPRHGGIDARVRDALPGGQSATSTAVDRDPELLPQAVEKLLRRFGVANLARVVRHDMDWRGVHLQAGDMILLSAPLGNLDARTFPDPLTVDFTRRDAGNNVSFGAGPHRCVGSFLARNELRIFLEEWLARIPEFAIKPGELVR